MTVVIEVTGRIALARIDLAHATLAAPSAPDTAGPTIPLRYCA